MEILPSSAGNEAIDTRDFWRSLVARPKEMLDRGETVRAKEPKSQIMKGDLAEPISGQLQYRGQQDCARRRNRCSKLSNHNLFACHADRNQT
jgi:hypothetical protein